MPILHTSAQQLGAPRAREYYNLPRSPEMQPYQPQPQQPGLMDMLGAGLGEGLGQGIQKSLYEQMEQGALERAFKDITPQSPLQQQLQAVLKAPESVRSGLLTHYLPAVAKQQEAQISRGRSQALGQFFKQNPKATAEDALIAGFTPQEIGGLTKARPAQQKPTATLATAFEKQFTKRLEGVTEKDDPLKLSDFAYQRRSDYEEAGLNPQQAINRTLKDVESRKDAVEELGSIVAGGPPTFLPESRLKSKRQEIQKFLEKGALSVEEAVPELKRAGWDDESIAVLISPELTPEVVDFFLKKTKRDPKKAKAMATEWGFKISE